MLLFNLGVYTVYFSSPYPGGREKGKKMKEKELLFYSLVLAHTENGVKPFFFGGGEYDFFYSRREMWKSEGKMKK